MEEELLNNCRNYFNEAQLSWDSYFSKWEAMAQEENVDDWDEDYLASLGAERETAKRKASVLRKQRNKSIFAVNGEKVRRGLGQRKTMDGEERRVHCESSNQGRGNEIIHKTENQTNLECEVVNNKHFEADLKAIFIEILSENTNKVGMFSVLSRMLPGNENGIGNFSFTSLITEKNEFSISAVGNRILHSPFGNGFIRRDLCPCGPVHRGLERKCASAGFCNITRIVDGSRLNLYRRDRVANLNDGYFGRAESLFLKRNRSDTIDDDRNVTRTLPSCSSRYLEDRSAYSLTVSSKKSAPSNAACSDNIAQCINQPADNRSSCLLASPEATLRKILSPSIPPSPQSPRSRRRSQKRKNVNPILQDSDDDSGDEKNNGSADSSPGRFLKIFCTPKRPRRCINSEEDDSPAVIEDPEDEEDCFDIVDRVENIENE